MRSFLRIRINSLSCEVHDARKLLQSRLSKRNACNSVVSCRRGMHIPCFALYSGFFLCISGVCAALCCVWYGGNTNVTGCVAFSNINAVGGGVANAVIPLSYNVVWDQVSLRTFICVIYFD